MIYLLLPLGIIFVFAASSCEADQKSDRADLYVALAFGCILTFCIFTDQIIFD